MARRGRAALACALVFVTVGCAHREERLAPRRRFVDTRAAALRAAEAPTASVGDVTRYVLQAHPAVQLYRATPRNMTVADASGVATVEFRCPAPLAGYEMRVEGTAPMSSAYGTADMRCPGADDPALRLDLRAAPSESILPVVIGHFEAPLERIETEWFPAEQDEVLHVALGLSDPARDPAAITGVRFSVRAEDRRGRSVELLTRTIDPARRAADRTWREANLHLSEAVRQLGRELRLIFETQPLGPPDALAFPVWGDPTLLAPTDSTRRPNVVLISLDTLRADVLDAYGFPEPTTPNLDRFAREGTLFEHTVAASNWTIPSHMSMLTGLSVCAHGVGPSVTEAGSRLNANIPTLAEMLRREGYRTAAFTEDAYMNPAQFQRGFGSFLANSSDRGTPRGEIEDTVDRATAWLLEHQDEEFFLFVHTYKVHAPYVAPPEFVGRLLAPTASLSGIAAPSNAMDAAAYLAAVQFTDEVIDGLLATLDRLHLSGRTIVVITSDHGEAFGLHGTSHHGFGLYQEEVEVPMIWRLPGAIAAGRRVATPVGLIDIVPTLLDLLYLQSPVPLEGISLRATMDPAPGRAVWQPPSRMLASGSMSGAIALRSGDLKAIWAGPAPLVFHLGRDPQELHPRPVAGMKPALRAMRTAYDTQCKSDRARLAISRARARAHGRDPEVDRKLRALGYVE